MKLKVAEGSNKYFQMQIGSQQERKPRLLEIVRRWTLRDSKMIYTQTRPEHVLIADANANQVP